MERKKVLAAKAMLAAVMVFTTAAMGWKLLDYHKGAQDYSEAAEIAQKEEVSAEFLPEETDGFAAMLAGLDLAALRGNNSDVIGWIAIPDTEVFYPVMQAADNSYYLNHTWKKEKSSVGAIFLDCRNEPDFNGMHSILYGHQMRNGSMFGKLNKYADADYLREHPAVYIATGAGVRKYDIFAAYEVGVQEIVYNMDMEQTGRQQEFVDFCLSHAAADTGIVLNTDSNILTLSTCTGRGYATRWVVQAVWNGNMET